MDRLADSGYQHLLVRPIKPRKGNEPYAMIFVTDAGMRGPLLQRHPATSLNCCALTMAGRLKSMG